MRPDSAGDTAELRALFRAHPILLTDHRISCACAIAYWWRMLDPIRSGGHVSWERLRASFAYPFFIRGRAAVVAKATEDGTLGNEKGITPKRYDAAMKRFVQAIKASGVPINPKDNAYPSWAGKSGPLTIATPSGQGKVADLLYIIGVPHTVEQLQGIAVQMEAYHDV